MLSVRPPTIQRCDAHYVGGRWVGHRGAGREVIDAYTEQVIARVPEGDAGLVDAAVAVAKAASSDWEATSASERAGVLRAIAAGLRARSSEIAETVAREVGTPIRWSTRVQVGLPIAVFETMADVLSDACFEETVGTSLVVREPVGVVAAITPWNYPLYQLAAKVAGALAAGCTVVAKPAEVAPLTAFVLAEVCDEVGLPPGVFNLVAGSGAVVGEVLAAHPDVDMVSFTGSTAAGRRVSIAASATVKRVALELGGKSACVVLDDADLSLAVSAAVASCFLNAGQTCAAQTRLLVPREHLSDAENIAAAQADAYRMGDPLDDDTTLGPLASSEQRECVRQHIDRARRDGARLICGGAAAPNDQRHGYFVRPTVFSDVDPSDALAQEEVFGPVLSIIGHRGDDDAVRIANDSRYGLSGAVWSASQDRAIAVARRIRTGQVAINGGAFNALAPFGGYKQSGLGRELGRFGLEEFLEVKSLQL
jgi:acyl-CoA reductase-like NAD-dependent aldehyde dehydrogenase